MDLPSRVGRREPRVPWVYTRRAMSTDPAETSSSDIALKFRAPSCVAQRWVLTTRWQEDHHTRVKRRFAFLETTLRYLVGTLAVEHAACGLRPVNSWDTLKRTLGDRPATLGLWADAARDLSLAVLAAENPVLDPIARVLAERDGRGVRQGEVCRDLDMLVHLRNEEAHPELVGLAVGAKILDETEDAFRRLLSSFRRVGKLPVWVCVGIDYRQGGHFADVRCLRGLEVTAPRRIALAKPLERDRPFVVSADGRLLYLSPMLTWGRFSDREPELRMFQGWKKGPLYADPLGLTDTPLAGLASTEMAAWFDAGCRGALVEGSFLRETEDLERLRDPDRSEPKPTVEGFGVGDSLGYGGNGRVYLAYDKIRGHQVALKLLPPAQYADPAARERMRRECAMMQSLVHPNIARVYEFKPDTAAGPVLVMEYVMGEDLRRCERAPISVLAAVKVMRQVLAGLACAHGHGIVHRDVTPENVVCDPTGGAKLLDFGIALAVGDDRMTRTLDGLGKLNFAAPEQFGGERVIGKPADVFSTGRLLGFLVSGSNEPAKHLAALPGALQALYRRATSEDPDRRFPDAAVMAADLERVVNQGWEGPPVSPGERLSGDVQVVAVDKGAGAGIWLVRVSDVVHDEPLMAAVAERRPEAEQALRRTIKELSSKDRKRLGNPHLLTTSDGVEWYLLRVSSMAEIGGAFGTPERLATVDEPAPRPPDLAPTRSAGGEGRSLKDVARQVAERAAAERGGGRAGAERLVAERVSAEAERVAAERAGLARLVEQAAAANAARAEAERAEVVRAAELAAWERVAVERAAAERVAADRAAADRAVVERAATLRAAADAPAAPSWKLPTRQQSGEAALESSILPGGPLGFLLALFPLYWPVLLLSLVRAAAGARVPRRPIGPVPSYVPTIPRFSGTTSPAQVARELDRLALIVLAQRQVRGVDSGSVDTVRGQPLLPAWSVLTLPTTGHLDDHRVCLVGTRGRLLAQSAVRHVHEAMNANASTVPQRSLYRLNHAALVLHRLAHGGGLRSHAQAVERVLAEWGVYQ